MLKIRTDIKPKVEPPPPLSEEAVWDLFNRIRAEHGLPVHSATPEQLERFKAARQPRNNDDPYSRL